MIPSLFHVALDRQMTWVAEGQRTWQRTLNLPRAIELACETKEGVTPYDVVFEEGSLRLLRYRRETPAAHSEPVLFCYALINRHYILDLQPDKSVVSRYLERGFDVYMIDWGIPSDDDRRLALRDYVCDFLGSVVDFVLQAHNRTDLHLLGYCMGGTISTMFAALHPEKVRSLTLMAAPLDFAVEGSLLNLWTQPEHFDVDTFVDVLGNCPAAFLQNCFLLMKPVQNLLEKHVALFDQLDDERFVANYFAMEYWVNDNIPVAGETFREFVKNLYQRNELVLGRFHLGEHRVDLERISCPLLVLTAKHDHLVVPSSTEGVVSRVGSRDVTKMSIDAGHVGLVVGGKAHKVFWPKATAWLSERSTRAAAPDIRDGA